MSVLLPPLPKDRDMLEQTAKAGDTRKTLEALRDRLAREIDETDKPLEVAQLSARMVEVLAKLDAMGGNQEGGTLHSIRGGREARRQEANGKTGRKRKQA